MTSLNLRYRVRFSVIKFSFALGIVSREGNAFRLFVHDDIHAQ